MSTGRRDPPPPTHTSFVLSSAPGILWRVVLKKMVWSEYIQKICLTGVLELKMGQNKGKWRKQNFYTQIRIIIYQDVSFCCFLQCES